MSKERMNVFYKDYEEEVKKNKKSQIIIKELKNRNKTLEDSLKKDNKRIQDLEMQIDKLIEKNNELENKLSKLISQANNNSTNSSIPSSKDTIKKKSPNEYNSRVKSDKKSGGQKGHKGKTLIKKDVLSLLKKPGTIYKEKIVYVKGKATKKKVEKYKVDVQVNTVITKYVYVFGENYEKIDIPKSEVFYGENLKAYCIDLNVNHSLSLKRIVEFINSLTDGNINLSEGTLINFTDEMNKKSKKTIDMLINKLLESKYLYTDGTPSTAFDSNVFFRNFSTKNITLYRALPSKSKKAIDQDGILNNFTNILVHDHEKTMYNYGTKHVECNAHVIRYLRKAVEDAKVEWPNRLIKFLTDINKLKKEKDISEEEYIQYEIKYDQILKEGEEENKKIKSQYAKEKTKTLLKRLKEYKKEHLLFAKEKDAPFTNNLSESDLRMIKRKTKISGGFRTIEGAKIFANIMSLIKTSIKRGQNVIETIKRTLKNEVAFD